MLLRTKLFVPRLQTQLVKRPQLFERLQMGVDKKLILISASAGFGKTTVVAEWLAQLGHPFAWYSLDAGDNTFVSFISYLAEAFNSIAPDLGQALLPLKQAQASISPEIAVQGLINDLILYEKPVVLALDDYHCIENPKIHEVLNFLLDHLPDNAHLVLISRTDPPFSISRLRVQGLVTEVRAEHLRFSSLENQSFFNEVMQLDLSNEDLAAMEKRTEGWVATLRLAALSLTEVSDKHAFISSFTGSDRYLVDYLMEEVLRHVPLKTREFLSRTSILDRFCAPLCHAVVGDLEDFDSNHKNQLFLQHLEASNLFLVPLDNERGWYRYHHLFGAFLQQYLVNHATESQIQCIHESASLWLEEEGLVDEAIDHAFGSKDYERVAGMIVAATSERLVQQEGGKVLKWLKQMPEEYFKKIPRLCNAYGWASLFQWDIERLDEMLTIGVENADQMPETPIAAEASIIRAIIEIHSGEHEEALLKCQKVIEELKGRKDREAEFVIALAYSGLVQVHHSTSLCTGEVEYAKAARLNLMCGNPAAYLSIIGLWGLDSIYKGKFQQALTLLEPGLQYVGASEGQAAQKYQAVACHIHLPVGDVFYKMNRLNEAEFHIQACINFVERGDGLGFFRTRAYYQMALLQKSKGSLEKSLFWLKKLERFYNDTASELQSLRVWMSEMINRLKLGMVTYFDECQFFLKDVVQWSARIDEEFPDILKTPFNFQWAQIAKTQVYFHVIHGDFERAEKDLAHLIEVFTEPQRDGDLIDLYSFLAFAQQKQGQLGLAKASLAKALRLAEPESIIQPFVDCSKTLGRLLGSIQSSDISSKFLESVLATFPEIPEETLTEATKAVEVQAPSKAKSDSNNKAQVVYEEPLEPLKDRELSILRALNGPLNNTEIAKELYLSVNTVRWYVKSIYSKLSVNSRREAVERAQELGILPT